MRAEGSDDFQKIRIQLEPTPVAPVDESRFKQSPLPGIPIREPDMVWVENTLSAMSLDEKIGQMLMTSQSTNISTQINDYHIGGFVFLGNSQNAQDIVNTVNSAQGQAAIPLWFSIDSEAGVGARVADATIFPLIMAHGAADDPALTELCGRITARESQALGIQTTLGPVVDVNTEPLNPIISTRSYSDNPFIVSKLAAAFITGARAEGVLPTFKHYPGHGATQGDSHSSLPTIDLSMELLEARHIKPYRQLADEGNVDLVMTAHVWYSQVDTGGPWPATLSSIFNTDILRDSIGFNGILISDAYNMQGLAIAVPDQGERGVVGVESGLDVILDTGDMGPYFVALKNAVQTERITEERIDESVRRVLIAKSRAGLPERTTVDPAAWQQVLNHPEHRAVVRQICEKAFTRAKNTLPEGPAVGTDESVLVLALSARTTIFYRFSSSYFTDPFGQAVSGATIEGVSRSLSTSEIDNYIVQANSHDKVVIAGYDWSRIASSDQVELINRMTDESSTPVIYVSFGAPYHYLQTPGVDAFYCGYSSTVAMQEVAVEVLTGAREAVGTLPVHVEGLNGPSMLGSYLRFE